MEKNIKVGILGYGEIGKAVGKFYENPKIKDINIDDGLENLDVLHVCIPYSEKFTDIVKEQINFSCPKITIIHSTVAPGTVKKIGRMVVHSPVRGVHPYLYEGIKTFVKFIGADDRGAAELAESHLTDLGIKVKVFFPSETTELGKILDTTYYGVCIAWHKEMKKICDQFNVDFSEAVTQFNETYNEGYKKLGKENVIRPVLFVDDGPIGGHCVVPNAKILKEYFSDEAIDLIIKYEKKQ